AGTLTASAQTTWTGGTMSGTGATVANGGLAIHAAGSVTVGHVTGVQTCALPISLSGGFFLEAGNNAIINNVSSGTFDVQNAAGRSEERRVGKECRSRRQRTHTKKNGDAATTISVVLSKSGTVSATSDARSSQGDG